MGGDLGTPGAEGMGSDIVNRFFFTLGHPVEIFLISRYCIMVLFVSLYDKSPLV